MCPLKDLQTTPQTVSDMPKQRMEPFTEKFTIKVTDGGVLMADHEGNSLSFTAGEALMLLDILRAEEAELHDMAEKASPLPASIRV
ncbi:MAG: hypothetical protein QG552_2798 [Thermodesulfobacteriota bacterium]|nr:hypothetical protein [Thermodesulfobacteriota bacterium]